MPRSRSGSRHCNGFALAVLAALALTGCALPYYAQAISGQMGIMERERPIARVLRDARTPRAVKHRLRYVLAVRRFARTHLHLPLHGDYRDYADLHRAAVVWNVFAAPRLSLTLKRWCFPVAGCVAYRGDFSWKRAVHSAQRLRKRGYDVFVAPVPAYATLGYFRDPVLSTFLDESRPEIAHLIFHELSHDLLYVPGATTFDESFADTVADVGVQRFLQAEGTLAERRAYARGRRRRREVAALLQTCRARLARVYRDTALPVSVRLRDKRRIFRALHAAWLRLETRWGGNHGFGAFFAQRFNNATLGAYASYHQLVPAFRRLLALEGGHLKSFYRAARWYARLPRPLRDRELASRRGLIGRLPALHKPQVRTHALKVDRPRPLGVHGPRLARAIEHRAHD